MEFRLEMEIRPAAQKIHLQDHLFLIGSCFTEQISNKLSRYKFSVLENPNGILFNPVSISKSLTRCISGRPYTMERLFEHGGLWSSWDHHSRFSKTDPEACLAEINESLQNASEFLKKANWLLITLGSAFVYQLSDAYVVANCHKMPADHFQKKLLQPEEILSELDNLLHRLFLFNSRLCIIFTVSPVRHLRDGFIENNRSKSLLITSVHHLVNKFEKLFYFPAYELIIDDLRDYRFYAEDMVHPNYLATDYVWQKFSDCFIDGRSREVMKEIHKLNAAKAHKPLHPQSHAHREFLSRHLEMAKQLKEKYPFLDLSEEIQYFSPTPHSI